MKCVKNSCNNVAVYKIEYDFGIDNQMKINICKSCYDSSEVFKRNIANIKEIGN